MVHDPRGKEKPTAPCMFNNHGEVTEVCHKSFPKEFLKETEWNESKSYATYMRRQPADGGGEALHNGRELNNTWIVPYNPYLLLRYNCHINVEICVSTRATKYMYN